MVSIIVNSATACVKDSSWIIIDSQISPTYNTGQAAFGPGIHGEHPRPVNGHLHPELLLPVLPLVQGIMSAVP